MHQISVSRAVNRTPKTIRLAAGERREGVAEALVPPDHPPGTTVQEVSLSSSRHISCRSYTAVEVCGLLLLPPRPEAAAAAGKKDGRLLRCGVIGQRVGRECVGEADRMPFVATLASPWGRHECRRHCSLSRKDMSNTGVLLGRDMLSAPLWLRKVYLEGSNQVM